MPKLKLNPATKKALNSAENKAEFIRDYLIKNYTVLDMADVIATYYLDETANVPKVKLTKSQFDEFFVISEK